MDHGPAMGGRPGVGAHIRAARAVRAGDRGWVTPDGEFTENPRNTYRWGGEGGGGDMDGWTPRQHRPGPDGGKGQARPADL